MKDKRNIQINIVNNNIVNDDTPYRMGLEKKHSLDVSTYQNEAGYTHVHLDFTTRLAMFEFGKSLMHEALFGYGNIEFNPYDFGNGPECVNGVRLTDMKTSIHSSCGCDDELQDDDIGIVSEDV